MIDGALESGADRIELYTKSFADLYPINPKKAIQRYIIASDHANNIGIGINAGHDLSLTNLSCLLDYGKIEEVSIGHALVVESLEFGVSETVNKYLKILQ